MCTAIFNVSGVTMITGHLQKIEQENIVKHGFLKPNGMFLAENSNKVFLPLGATEPKIEIWPLDHSTCINIVSNDILAI